MKQLIEFFLFLLFFFLFCFASLEISTFFLLQWQNQHVLCVYEADKETGFKLAPNLKTSYAGASGEYDYEIETNSRGERNREIGLEEIEPIILSVGDSFAFGQGVANDATYAAKLSLLLNEEVINAGVGSYNNEQEMRTVERYLQNGIKIKTVIFQLFSANDVYENLVETKEFGVENNCLKGNPKPVTDIKSFLRENLLSYKYYAEKVRGVPILREFLIGIGFMQGKRPPVYNEVLKNPPSELFEQGWKETEFVLNSLEKLAEENDFNVIVIDVPCITQVSDGLRKQAFASYGVAEEGYEFDYPEKRLSGFLEGKKRIVFVGLLDEFRKHGTELYFVFDPHLNEKGHGLVAELVGRSLVET